MTTISGLPYVPNVHFKHSVLLDAPIEEVFAVLGTNLGHERASRLNPLCTIFDLTEKDTTAIPPGKQLYEVSLRAQPPASGDGIVLVNRQFFKFEERVPLLFGLFHSKVKLSGALSWLDPESVPSGGELYSLYESIAEGTEIKIWKIRKFGEEVVDGKRKTRVSEEAHVWAPTYLRLITEKLGTKAHSEHMELFHGLFPWNGNSKGDSARAETGGTTASSTNAQ